MTNRTYRYFKGEPLYPFGYGLGYARFSLSDAVYKNGKVTVTVSNDGGFDQNAAASIQVYAEVEGTKEFWNLCGLGKVRLTKGEKKTVEIEVSEAAFGRYDADGKLQPCDGAKYLHVGFTQPDERSVALTGNRPVKLRV
jgi:beta-glucosidase